MKKTLILAVAAFVCLIGIQAEAAVSHSNAPALAVSNTTNACTGADGTGGVTDTIAYTEAGTISDVNVAVEITHTWRGDLQFHVSYDSGAAGNIVLAAGHAGSIDNYFATFDDEGALLCSDAAVCGDNGAALCTDVATAQICQPDVALSAFDALTSPGTWTMMMCDSAAGDDGVWDTWTMTVDGDGDLPVELMTFIVE